MSLPRTSFNSRQELPGPGTTLSMIFFLLLCNSQIMSSRMEDCKGGTEYCV